MIYSLGGWLEDRCRKEGLSLRQAATKTGLSHATIAHIVKGGHASPESVRKLADAFSESGDHEKVALEDELLVLAGYRRARPQQGELSQPLARLMDIVSEFSGSQLKLMVRFAEFVAEMMKKR